MFTPERRFACEEEGPGDFCRPPVAAQEEGREAHDAAQHAPQERLDAAGLLLNLGQIQVAPIGRLVLVVDAAERLLESVLRATKEGGGEEGR